VASLEYTEAHGKEPASGLVVGILVCWSEGRKNPGRVNVRHLPVASFPVKILAGKQPRADTTFPHSPGWYTPQGKSSSGIFSSGIKCGLRNFWP